MTRGSEVVRLAGAGIVLGALLAFLPAAATERVPETGGLVWLGDLDRALERAAEEGKPVLAYFAYRSCPWCRRMENESYRDPRVVERSRKFVLVRVDRDRDEATHAAFKVTEYPTLIALNEQRENIDRFSGFRDGTELAEALDETLRRFERMSAGQPLGAARPSDESISDRGRITTVAAPADDVPTGICVLGDHLWIVQAQVLYQTDKRSGEVLRRQPLSSHVVDLATDGKLLFIAPFGWTSGEPIPVYDPASGKFVRHLFNAGFRKRPRGYRTHGIEFRDGLLDVLAIGTLHRVDPRTGAITSRTSVDLKYRGLSRQGELLATGAPDAVVFFDPDTGTPVRRIPMRRPVRGVAGDDESLFLVGQPVYDFDQQNERVRIWPKDMVVYRMMLSDADRGLRSTRIEPGGPPAEPEPAGPGETGPSRTPAGPSR